MNCLSVAEQFTFYVSLTSQDKGHSLLLHFLASKSLFWCNLPLIILSEYPLDSRILLCILLYPLPSNCCFFFDLSLFCYFFLFLLTSTCFSLIALFHFFLAHTFSLVFIDFKLFKFSFGSSTSSTLFLWFSLVFFFVFCFNIFS